jgi:hypothetical protein
MDFRSRASSNSLSNIVSESGSTDSVEGLVRLQAEVAGDDFFLDLGGAAEDQLVVALLGQRCLFDDNAEPIGPGVRAVDADVNTDEIIVAQLALARSVSAASTGHCG